MAEKKNEIAEQKQPTFSMILNDGLIENKDALPKDFNIARFVQNSVALLNGNDTLMNYAKNYGTAPIKACLLRGAYLGLDALNGEFHPVPYGSKLNFMLDFKGAMKLIEKYSVKPVDYVKADVVRNGDEFNYWEEDGIPHYSFKPKMPNDGAITMAFAVVKYKDGTVLVEMMTLAQMEKTRQQSKAKNSLAWSTFTEEMYKKTVIHRLKKRIPLDFENPLQKEIFDDDGAINIEQGRVEQEYHDFNEQPQAEDIVVESTVIEEEQIELPDFLKGE